MRGKSTAQRLNRSVATGHVPAAGELENVSLYNIDDLEVLDRQGVHKRELELAACRQIIEAHVARLIGKLIAENERLYLAGPKQSVIERGYN